MSYFDLDNIKYLLVHHTGETGVKGPTFKNWSSDRIRSYLSGVGFSRGYQKHGYDKKTGYTKKFNMTCPFTDPITGYHVYPMYHVSFRKFDESPTGWIGTALLKDPEKYNVNSLSGAWPQINKNAISINFCGNYEHVEIDQGALITAALTLWDLVKKYKPEIKGHKEFDKTGCPGKILDQLDFFKSLFSSSILGRMAEHTKQIIKA